VLVALAAAICETEVGLMFVHALITHNNINPGIRVDTRLIEISLQVGY